MTRGAAALCALAALAGCVAARPSARPARSVAPATIVAALAHREQATRGLRLSMTVRASGADGASVLPSPAYLAVDGGGEIRLQVLSTFGVTVLDLAIHGDRYALSLPLKHEARDGAVDLATLADPSVAAGDRMIVALALLFRPKARAEACAGAGASTVACRVAPGLVARVTVDERLRPIREEYAGDDGRPLLVATYDGYRADDPSAAPGSLLLVDPRRGASLAIEVRRARLAAAPVS